MITVCKIIFKYLRKMFFRCLSKKSRFKKLCNYYHERMNRLDQNSIVSFNKKMLYLSVYEVNSIKSILVDKYRVKDYVSDKIGNEYVIPLLGVYKNAEQIDFEKLPDKFVLKSNNSYDNDIIIVSDKKNHDIQKTKAHLNKAMKTAYFSYSRCLFGTYRNVPPRIIAEQYINSPDDYLVDYKFYCFHGEPKFLLYCCDRNIKLKGLFIDLNWEKMPFSITKAVKLDKLPEKPKNFDKMIELAKILSKEFKFVRIDLYNVDGKIYFGEFTFVSGLNTYEPEEYEIILGDMIKL